MSITGISLNSSQSLNADSHLFRQDFKKIGQDLKSGDLSAAQQDLLAMQKDLRTQFNEVVKGAHHNHLISMGPGNFLTYNSLRNELKDLGQALSTGDLAAAQQAYATMKSGKYTTPPLKEPSPNNAGAV